jgi:2-polyprenyl-6-methoxyphenol hydroxylase-like FAD-dependent oxidoreductase
MTHAPVLIVGAGPTGLALALVLARRGVRVRIIDDDEGPGAGSRAIVVHARTLELYRQLGLADDVVAAGMKIDGVRVREARAQGIVERLSLRFGDLGRGLSPYPYLLAYPQDDHERLLAARLREAGGHVQWSRRLVGLTREDEGMRAVIARPDGALEDVTADYVCGCDGAHSTVRDSLAVGFPGGTYDQLFFVTDVRMAGACEPGMTAFLGRTFVALMLPVRSSGTQRLLGLVPPALGDRADLGFEDLRSHLESLVGARVVNVNWFATYRVHHRVADQFRIGRTFLVGDAAHIHSPAGGQGMNTGIGDAVNLGWKLADVIRGRLAAPLLDTYESERIDFARTLVASTDRAFRLLTAAGAAGRVVRHVLAPLFATAATRFAIGRRAVFRTVSQIRVRYPRSALSEGRAGRVSGGDRLPWTGGTGVDNFAPLQSFAWQLHVYGAPAPGLHRACSDLELPLHVFDWDAAAERAGLEKDAYYLVRPDAHVGLASATQDVAALKRYVHSRGVRV